MNFNSFQNTCEQDSILPVVSKRALIVYLQGDNHCIYPYETIKEGKTSTNYFKLTRCGIYEVYVDGILQNSIDPIYVIPKEATPINSMNKYLFDYRYD